MMQTKRRCEYDNYSYPKQENRIEVTNSNRADYLKALEELREFTKKTANEARKESLQE